MGRKQAKISTFLISTQHYDFTIFLLLCFSDFCKYTLVTRFYCYSHKNMLSLAAGHDFEISEQYTVFQNNIFVQKRPPDLRKGEKATEKELVREKPASNRRKRAHWLLSLPVSEQGLLLSLKHRQAAGPWEREPWSPVQPQGDPLQEPLLCGFGTQNAQLPPNCLSSSTWLASRSTLVIDWRALG